MHRNSPFLGKLMASASLAAYALRFVPSAWRTPAPAQEKRITARRGEKRKVWYSNRGNEMRKRRQWANEKECARQRRAANELAERYGEPAGTFDYQFGSL